MSRRPALRAPELSRRLSLQRVMKEGTLAFNFAANPEERAAVAGRLGLIALERLEAALVLTARAGDVITVEGPWWADVVQACVVTLEPVPATLTDSLVASFAAAPTGRLQRQAREEETLFDPEAPDPAEPMPEDGSLDVGELVVQSLAVALDPYPRKPGTVWAGEGAGHGDADAGPFSALARLKEKPRS